MIENIAIIKEVHEHLSVDKAEKLAYEYLDKVALSNIGQHRLNQCTSLEIFYIMFIRALMAKEMNVIIVAPFSLIKNIKDINRVIDNINIIKGGKTIFLLDDIDNETHYKGCLCNIVK
jgi:hypothetical protein